MAGILNILINTIVFHKCSPIYVISMIFGEFVSLPCHWYMSVFLNIFIFAKLKITASQCSSYLHFSFLMFIYLFILRERDRDRERERERKKVLGRGRKKERERRREREFQAGYMLSVQSPTRSSISQTVRSWPEPKPKVGCLMDWVTQVPLIEVSF